MSRLEVIGVEGIGEVEPGDDLGALVAGAAELVEHDVVVVTQKIVSKAEGRLVAVDPDDPLAHKALVEAESVRVLRRRGDLPTATRDRLLGLPEEPRRLRIPGELRPPGRPPGLPQ